MSVERADRYRSGIGGQEGGGFGDPALLAGRPFGSFAHLLVLAAAAAADFGQFYGIIELVVDKITDQTALLIVCGFTAVVLFLAHAAGATFRDRRAGVQSVRRELPWLCVAGWLVLGACALYVRLAQSGASGVNGIKREGDSAPPAETVTHSHLIAAALLFLALYIATGLAAGVGGYLSHNPARSAYLRARVARALAARRAARAALAMQVATGNRQLQESYRHKAVDVLRRERDRRWALAEELKQHARLVMAQRAKDPAMTDALFGPDRNPYQPPEPLEPLESQEPPQPPEPEQPKQPPHNPEDED